MDNAVSDPRLGIGANNPPDPTAFEICSFRIDSLYDEATLWLDGTEVDTPEMADGLAHLLTELRKAEDEADKARTEDKRPHLEAGRAVDAAYKPLLSKVGTAIETCRKAIQPWLERRAEVIEEQAVEMRRNAAVAMEEATQAIRAADRADLAAVEEVERRLTAAKKLSAAATEAEKATARAGEYGRAVSLRTSYAPVMTDAAEALKHYKGAEPEALKQFLLSLAVRDVRAGKRTIPGFSVEKKHQAV